MKQALGGFLKYFRPAKREVCLPSPQASPTQSLSWLPSPLSETSIDIKSVCDEWNCLSPHFHRLSLSLEKTSNSFRSFECAIARPTQQSALPNGTAPCRIKTVCNSTFSSMKYDIIQQGATLANQTHANTACWIISAVYQEVDVIKDMPAG